MILRQAAARPGARRAAACMVRSGQDRYVGAFTVAEVVLRTIAPFLLLLLLALAVPSSASLGGELRIASWNLEHLNDTDGAGCVPREGADYDAIAQQVVALHADVVAFQEVENEAAARRVFPSARWHVAVSSRPAMNPGRACWRRPEARLGHLATGFAIRRGIAWSRNEDVTALGAGDRFQRWGTDITVTVNGRDLRLLSVHLRTGCWSAKQDGDGGRAEGCATLRGQMLRLRAWADARRAEGTPFVILGDFNRRLAVPGDWAWRLLSLPAARLRLATSGLATGCDPRFTALIDHLVVGGGAEAMLVPGSTRELPRHGPHPDHCAVSASFRIGGTD